MSDERINSIKTSDYGITPYLGYYETNKIKVKFDGRCLKQDTGLPFLGGILNVYIVYKMSKLNSKMKWWIITRKLFIWSC